MSTLFKHGKSLNTMQAPSRTALSSDGAWSIWDSDSDVSHKAASIKSIHSDRDDVKDKLLVLPKIIPTELYNDPIKYNKSILWSFKASKYVPRHRRGDLNKDSTTSATVFQLLKDKNSESKVCRDEKEDKLTTNKIHNHKKTDRLMAGRDLPRTKSHVQSRIIPKIKPAESYNNSVSPSISQSLTVKNSKPKVRRGDLNKDSTSASVLQSLSSKSFNPKVRSSNTNKYHACCVSNDVKKQHSAFSDDDVKNHGVNIERRVEKNHNHYNSNRSKLAKLTMERYSFLNKKTKKKQIINVYTNNINKVRKLAPFVRKSSSFINRQAKEKETDRINFILMQKLLHVKASVSTFH